MTHQRRPVSPHKDDNDKPLRGSKGEEGGCAVLGAENEEMRDGDTEARDGVEGAPEEGAQGPGRG